MPLSDMAVRNAKPKEKPYKLSDALGLFLLVQPSGGRLWRYKYRVDGKERKLSIGVYPQVSLAEARRRRDAARELLAAGKDPCQEKNATSSKRKLALNTPFKPLPKSIVTNVATMVQKLGLMLQHKDASIYFHW